MSVEHQEKQKANQKAKERPGKAYLGLWVKAATLQRVDQIAARRSATRSDIARELLGLGLRAYLAGEREPQESVDTPAEAWATEESA